MQQLSKYYVDFGGEGPLLHFIHANGFPPETYQQFFKPLLTHFRVVGLRLPPLLEPAENAEKLKTWDSFAEFVLEQADVHGFQPRLAMGHSLGAVVTMLTANKQPTFCQRAILLDPVFLTKSKVRLMKWLPGAVVKRHPMIRKTLLRPDVWPDKQQALAFHQPKRAFRTWQPEVLHDYIEFGTCSTDDGEVTLAYPKLWEAKVYGTVRSFWPDLDRHTVPLTIIKGEHSDVICADAWRDLKNSKGDKQLIEFADTGHLLPMEKPQQLAQHIMDMI